MGLEKYLVKKEEKVLLQIELSKSLRNKLDKVTRANHWTTREFITALILKYLDEEKNP